MGHSGQIYFFQEGSIAGTLDESGQRCSCQPLLAASSGEGLGPGALSSYTHFFLRRTVTPSYTCWPGWPLFCLDLSMVARLWYVQTITASRPQLRTSTLSKIRWQRETELMSFTSWWLCLAQMARWSLPAVSYRPAFLNPWYLRLFWWYAQDPQTRPLPGNVTSSDRRQQCDKKW